MGGTFRSLVYQSAGIPATWFHSPRIPESVRAGYIKLTVRPYIPNPIQCFKCQRFGQSKASYSRSLTSAEAGHDSSNCTEFEKCVNCKGSHTSFSRLCSAWKFEKEIIAEKLKKDISFLEARRLVKSRTPPIGTSYVTAGRKTPETIKTQILPAILPPVPFKTSYIPSEICPKSPESFLNFSAIHTHIETVSFQSKVSERSEDPPDFSDFKTVTHKKKFKEDSRVNQHNIYVDKISQFYKLPQLTDKEPSEASSSVIKQNNITIFYSGTKSPHVCSCWPCARIYGCFPSREKSFTISGIRC
ncbi:hypothetical protein AVEN_61446-1 [Araneus ventricosus]|uniref:Uncharacterized protein n=1 Tax=Araneus ventricosus TaxID=182803 RepID=A0A4Y2KFK5_ARAVE|nr:hypothetical protein AVEN_61446-1 [Araneus ventricosus]